MSGGGGAAQGHPNQSSSARSTAATCDRSMYRSNSKPCTTCTCLLGPMGLIPGDVGLIRCFQWNNTRVFTPEKEVTGEIPEAQSCIANKRSTLTRMAQQHHHENLRNNTAEQYLVLLWYSCTFPEQLNACRQFFHMHTTGTRRESTASTSTTTKATFRSSHRMLWLHMQHCTVGPPSIVAEPRYPTNTPPAPNNDVQLLQCLAVLRCSAACAPIASGGMNRT